MGYIGIPSKICPSLPFGGYTPYQMELFVLVVLFRKDREENALPIGSMYAIFGSIYHQYTPNVSIYTIHGSYGLWNGLCPKFSCLGFKMSCFIGTSPGWITMTQDLTSLQWCLGRRILHPQMALFNSYCQVPWITLLPPDWYHWSVGPYETYCGCCGCRSWCRCG